jgi:hypothetical protein
MDMNSIDNVMEQRVVGTWYHGRFLHASFGSLVQHVHHEVCHLTYGFQFQ